MEAFFFRPPIVFLITIVTLLAAGWLGSWLRQKVSLDEKQREDFSLVLASTLTLLGLLIGFSFSMAVNRYDQRKNLEEAEANAIGTEYLRADLLPDAEASKTRRLLKEYTGQRIRFYESHDHKTVDKINTDTARLQNEMWAVVRTGT